jgi:hypothetical protein
LSKAAHVSRSYLKERPGHEDRGVLVAPVTGTIPGMLATVDLDVIQRVLKLDEGLLPPEVANYFPNLRLNEADHSRMAKLNVKANRGKLNAEEERELDSYIWLCDALAILHSKARQSLKARHPAA